jgi:predicted enzyme related to lactoylglutathione lyase
MSHRHFPFVVLEIEAENLHRARTFYTSVFGWTFEPSDTEAGALEAELGADHDTMVRVHLRPRDLPVSGSGASAARESHSLCVHDLTPILAGVLACGGQLISGPVDVHGVGRMLYVRDSEGNDVAVLEPSHDNRHMQE